VHEDWITTREAGELIEVGASRIRQFVLEGRLIPIKRGRDLFLRREDVERLKQDLARGHPHKRGPKFKVQRPRGA